MRIVFPGVGVGALTLILITGYCCHRRLRKNKTKDNQESDNREINYQSTRCPEKKSQGDMV